MAWTNMVPIISYDFCESCKADTLNLFKDVIPDNCFYVLIWEDHPSESSETLLWVNIYRFG